MSVDDLWRLHESIVKVITRKIRAETQRLENRLRLLGPAVTSRDAPMGNHPTVGSHVSPAGGLIRKSSLNIEIAPTRQ